MFTFDSYIGMEIFTVPIDDSPQLQQLVRQARELRGLPFEEKLDAVKHLTLDAAVNAYEQMVVWNERTRRPGNSIEEATTARQEWQKYKDIVFQKHPLSYGLEQEAMCCRYQGALFFILGYEADLGDQHYVQCAPVNGGMNTVFNELVHEGKVHKISIFTESLHNKSLDYTIQNPDIFNQAFERLPGYAFFSYHRTPKGLVLVGNPHEHVKTLKE
jgi:hypothetical protein